MLPADSITRAYFFQTGTPQISSLVTLRFRPTDHPAESNATTPHRSQPDRGAYARAALALSPFAVIVTTFTASAFFVSETA